MKVYFIRLRKPAKLLVAGAVFLLILLITAVILQGTGAIRVFSQNPKIPIYSVECGEKKAAITFDCAWGADDIPDILDVLKKADVKATFFIVGQWAEKYPDKVRMIALAGHDIANHSYSHLRMGSLDRNKIKNEIELCGRKLSELSGTKVDLFRVPYGDYSGAVVDEAEKLGYYTIQWNVDSLDWKPDIGKEEIMSRVMSKVKPGSIILFHNDTAHTAGLLPGIIEGLKSSGYEFVPVSELILRGDYTVDFEGRQKKK